MKIMKDKSYTKKPKEVKIIEEVYKYKLMDLLIQFDIDVKKFREILTKLLSYEGTYH